MKIDDTIWTTYRDMVPRLEEPEPNTEAGKLRETIIVTYLYLTKRVVGKMKQSMPSHVEREDLESWANVGLLQAVQRFDHTLGVPFEAFATQRMRSVIMDAIRDADWAPRSLRKKQRDIVAAEEAFKQENGRTPTNAELSDEVDMDPAEISSVRYRSEIAAHTYIEGNVEAQNKAEALDPDEADLVRLMKQSLSVAYRQLPPRKAAVIALHYFEEKKLSDIAKILRTSEVKVGTIHQEAVLELWDALKDVIESEE